MEMGMFLMFVTYAIVQLIVVLGFAAINSLAMIVIIIMLLVVLCIVVRNAFIINTGIRKIQNVKKGPVFSKI